MVANCGVVVGVSPHALLVGWPRGAGLPPEAEGVFARARGAPPQHQQQVAAAAALQEVAAAAVGAAAGLKPGWHARRNEAGLLREAEEVSVPVHAVHPQLQ
jgi:hypothetical protein